MTPSDMAEMSVASAEIVNRKGLHARAAAAVSRVAGQYDARLTLVHGGLSADACSIMDLLLLVAPQGSRIEIRGEGPRADEAVEAVRRLVADGFGE